MQFSDALTFLPIESRRQWVPHGFRAVLTQREVEKARMRVCATSVRKATADPREAQESVALAMTQLATECVAASFEVEQASAAFRLTQTAFATAVTREANTFAALRRSRLKC